MLKSRVIPNFNTKFPKSDGGIHRKMKIYDWNGKKNICGNRVHEARQRLRMTQSDLAAQLQVAGIIMERDSVSRIEIGTRFVADYELLILAKCLKVSPAWLLGIEL